MSDTLRVLRPSRKAIRPGDVFAMGLPDGAYLFGRVVSTSARWTLAADSGVANLVYVFDHRSTEKRVPDRTYLRTDRLLVPPQLINRLGWSRGYFETLANLDFEDGEVLPVHCFQSNASSRGPRWFDEYANELPGPVPPVGGWGSGNWRTVEDDVFAALGIPLPQD
jgi:hypothetical protein